MRKMFSVLCSGLAIATLLCGCSQLYVSSDEPSNGEQEIADINKTKKSGAKQSETNSSGESQNAGNENSEASEGEPAGAPAYEEVHDFSYELLKNNMDKENPVLSPVSAYIALSMVGNGAKNDTLSEFQDVLGEDMLTTPADMMNKLPRKEETVKLTLANSAWIDEKVEVDKDWAKKMDQSFRADTYNRKLSTGETMKKINEWVDQNTNGLIDKMLENPLDADTCLVLYNTLYFKADWQYKFDGLNTREAEFYLEDGTSCAPDMMRMYGEDVLYVHNEVAEGVVLPYADEELVFLALKPSSEGAQDRTVREMYEALTWKEISEFLQQEEKTLCNLILPKFRVEFDESLNEALINMGLVDAFDPRKADLSGLGRIKTENNIYISLVRQKALVIVDEEGTEAAAVTEVAARETAAFMEEEPVDIFLDEPFLYIIADKNTNVPLFMGIMDCPED